MSSRRYQEDIRRIVGMPDVVGGLSDDIPRMRIDGARGIYQQDGSTKSGNASGEDEDGNKVDPVTPDEDSADLNEDGSGTGLGGGEGSGVDDGSDFIIDPEDPGNFSPDDTTFGDGWGSGGVSTLQDCVDGKCIEIVDRGGYVPPEGWDSADSPPEIDPSLVDSLGYLPGYVWSGVYATAVAAANADGRYCTPRPPENSVSQSIEKIQNEDRYVFKYLRRLGESCPSPGGVGTQQWSVNALPGDPTSAPDYGDLSPSSWPSDNCIQLAPNADGQWAASEYESPDDMTAKYSEAKSILDLCTPNGDGVQILPGADGGTVRWNYTQGRFMAISPDGRRSFGGATEITTAVAGSVAGGGAIKASGAAVPSG